MGKKGGWSSHGAAWMEGRREMKLRVRKLALVRPWGPDITTYRRQVRSTGDREGQACVAQNDDSRAAGRP